MQEFTFLLWLNKLFWEIKTQVCLFSSSNFNNLDTFINIKGILVGNGVTDQVFDGNALVPFIWGHSLIPDDMYSEVGNYFIASNV